MTYTFSTDRNSYFNGHDLRITREDGEDIVVNWKDDMWAVNVKHSPTIRELAPSAQLALLNLGEGVVEGLESHAKDTFWRDAQSVGEEYGFDNIFTAGRSGGWAAFEGTQSWPAEDIFNTDDELTRKFLLAAFELVTRCIDDAEADFAERLAEAQQELQLELREYSDWVGAKVSSLDGARFTIERLDVRQGRAVFMEAKPATSYSFANEVNLIDKADSALPFSECQGCGRSYPDANPGHNTGCVIGALLTTLEDRGFDFTNTSVANIDAESWWDGTFGPACDEIENELRA